MKFSSFCFICFAAHGSSQKISQAIKPGFARAMENHLESIHGYTIIPPGMSEEEAKKKLQKRYEPIFPLREEVNKQA